MTWTESPPPRFPKVQIWRRGCALFIDIVPVWIASSLLGGSWLAQLLLWMILRVLVVSANRGQSFGRWALDMRIMDDRTGKTPGVLELSKREGILGLAVVMAIAGFTNLSPTTAQYLLLMIPLAADCGIAYFEPLRQQAFHDRLAGTAIAGTRRGYALDIKIKKLVAHLRRLVKQ